MGGSIFIGKVVSNRMQKTVVVAVSYVVWVPKYKVYEKRVARHMAHDETQACKVGDMVKIRVCRKLSKHKSYRVSDILMKTPTITTLETRQAVQQLSQGQHLNPVDLAKQRLEAAHKKLAELRDKYQQRISIDTEKASLQKTTQQETATAG